MFSANQTKHLGNKNSLFNDQSQSQATACDLINKAKFMILFDLSLPRATLQNLDDHHACYKNKISLFVN